MNLLIFGANFKSLDYHKRPLIKFYNSISPINTDDDFLNFKNLFFSYCGFSYDCEEIKDNFEEFVDFKMDYYQSGEKVDISKVEITEKEKLKEYIKENYHLVFNNLKVTMIIDLFILSGMKVDDRFLQLFEGLKIFTLTIDYQERFDLPKEYNYKRLHNVFIYSLLKRIIGDNISPFEAYFSSKNDDEGDEKAKKFFEEELKKYYSDPEKIKEYEKTHKIEMKGMRKFMNLIKQRKELMLSKLIPISVDPEVNDEMKKAFMTKVLSTYKNRSEPEVPVVDEKAKVEKINALIDEIVGYYVDNRKEDQKIFDALSKNIKEGLIGCSKKEREDFDTKFKKKALEVIENSKKGSAMKGILKFSLQGYLQKVYKKYSNENFLDF